jgi:hypothetical protein
VVSYFPYCCTLFNDIVLTDNSISIFIAVNFEARLEDGTLIAKSEGVEFTVKEGMFLVIV